MSGQLACRCRPRNLVIVDYMCNHSAFNGYHRTRSDYSLLRCMTCGHCYRTKAAYVTGLPMATEEQWQRNFDGLPNLRIYQQEERKTNGEKK